MSARVVHTERGSGPPLLLIHGVMITGEMRCPTLVLAGAVDTAVPMYHARQLHEGIAGSWPLVIEDGDHADLGAA
ncbi:MAG: hypothetical protein ABIT71_18970 [Vicinamibacteraceae bacterium]